VRSVGVPPPHAATGCSGAVTTAAGEQRCHCTGPVAVIGRSDRCRGRGGGPRGCGGSRRGRCPGVWPCTGRRMRRRGRRWRGVLGEGGTELGDVLAPAACNRTGRRRRGWRCRSVRSSARSSSPWGRTSTEGLGVGDRGSPAVVGLRRFCCSCVGSASRPEPRCRSLRPDGGRTAVGGVTRNAQGNGVESARAVGRGRIEDPETRQHAKADMRSHGVRGASRQRATARCSCAAGPFRRSD
jgi:hypothetical protein